MNQDHFRQVLETQKAELEKEIARYTAEDPYLEKVRNTEVMDDAISEIEGHDRLAATSDQLKGDLAEVKSALSRVEAGNFGICVSCGKKIELDRLEAMPWAKMCLACQTKTKEG